MPCPVLALMTHTSVPSAIRSISAVLPLDTGARAPGVYRLNWSAAGQPQGAWTFRVVADDDQGRHSVAERDFTLRG